MVVIPEFPNRKKLPVEQMEVAGRFQVLLPSLLIEAPIYGESLPDKPRKSEQSQRS
jgi:hypothetical protein